MSTISLPGTNIEIAAEAQAEQIVIELRRRERLPRLAAHLYIIGTDAIGQQSQRNDFWDLLKAKHRPGGDIGELIHLGSQSGERRPIVPGRISSTFNDEGDFRRWLDLSGEFGSFWSPTVKIVRTIVGRQLHKYNVDIVLIQGQTEIAPYHFDEAEFVNWMRSRANLPTKPTTKFSIVGCLGATRSFCTDPNVSYFAWSDWASSSIGAQRQSSSVFRLHIKRPKALPQLACTVPSEAHFCSMNALPGEFVLRVDYSSLALERVPIGYLTGFKNHNLTLDIVDDRIILIPREIS